MASTSDPTAAAAAHAMAPAASEVHSSGLAMKECIENCRECERTCLETIPHCLSKGGHHARPDHIMLLMNCAAMCATSSRFLISGSHLHVHTCAACKEVCEACAEDCEGMMGENDECMRTCAEACRACAKTCGAMAAGRC